jgi:cobalamin biosynthesis Mg chelatase CobN
MKRRTLPTLFAACAVFLTAFGFGTPSSFAAGIDPEVVAQSIAEDGYYIDSSAQYLQADTAQDQLRSQLERSKSPVFVAVIPAGTSLSPVQVYRLAKRKGTYAVLTGGKLRAASNTLSAARVDRAVSQAVQTHSGDPGAAVVAFVRLTNGTAKPATSTRRSGTPTPTSTASTAEPSAEPSASSAPAAAAEEQKGGGNGPLLALVGVLGLILAAGVGYWVYRRGHGPKKSPV